MEDKIFSGSIQLYPVLKIQIGFSDRDFVAVISLKHHIRARVNAKPINWSITQSLAEHH